jgi:hypothetical protein
VAQKKAGRWSVNNGSQIVGPYTPKEIAKMLFSQELDFDCECWAEGTGTSSQIRTAGMFEGTDESGADLWLYDGETVHGPINEGFLKTAIGHGAVNMDSVFICQGSTVNGWKKIEAWNPHFLDHFEKEPVPSAASINAAPVGLPQAGHALENAPIGLPPNERIEEEPQVNPQKKAA